MLIGLLVPDWVTNFRLKVWARIGLPVLCYGTQTILKWQILVPLRTSVDVLLTHMQTCTIGTSSRGQSRSMLSNPRQLSDRMKLGSRHLEQNKNALQLHGRRRDHNISSALVHEKTPLLLLRSVPMEHPHHLLLSSKVPLTKSAGATTTLSMHREFTRNH